MEIWIALAAFAASMLTLFSGFGLGTILMPVFGLFFPIELAVAMTAVVHILNNLFKISLLAQQASRQTVLRFGLPSVFGGFAGAWVLTGLSRLPALHSWQYGDKIFEISWLKGIVALLMLIFALMELAPRLHKLNFARRYMTLGGLLSGFFGGLSGHQGALRSAFLINCGLSKEQFIATGVAVAVLVDLARLPVYFNRFASDRVLEHWPIMLLATCCAFAGAYLGARYLKKVTLAAVRWITATMILVIAFLLGAGIL